MAEIALARLRGEGTEIIEGAKISEALSTDGGVALKTEDGTQYAGTHLLVASGRRPNLDKLDLDKAGIKTDRRGVVVDAGLRSSNRRVYAIGDAAGGLQFTHVAGYHAGVVVRSALFGLPAKASYAHIPWTTYIDPEMAHVGLSEAEAREKFGDSLTVVRFNYEDNDRARADLATDGLIKLMVVKGRPVGASIVGAHAGELIATWSMAIANKLKLSAVANMVASYPTYVEINKRAAGAYFGEKLFSSNLVKCWIRFVQRFG